MRASSPVSEPSGNRDPREANDGIALTTIIKEVKNAIRRKRLSLKGNPT